MQPTKPQKIRILGPIRDRYLSKEIHSRNLDGFSFANTVRTNHQTIAGIKFKNVAINDRKDPGEHLGSYVFGKIFAANAPIAQKRLLADNQRLQACRYDIVQNQNFPKYHSEVSFLQDITDVPNPATQSANSESFFYKKNLELRNLLKNDLSKKLRAKILLRNQKYPPCITDGKEGQSCERILSEFAKKASNDLGADVRIKVTNDKGDTIARKIIRINYDTSESSDEADIHSYRKRRE